MDEAGVFDSTHRLIFELVERGMIDGLRIDHVDGLYDPQAYLERLQTKSLYVVVEKILAPYERLPETWPVQARPATSSLR
jgi:(1->4)-alpha-D-glucan 1-alpha-D-glucosylmutase